MNSKYCAGAIAGIALLVAMHAGAQNIDVKAEVAFVRQAIQNGDYQAAWEHDQAVTRAALAGLKQHPEPFVQTPTPKPPVTTADFLVIVDQTERAVEAGDMTQTRDYSMGLGIALYKEYTRRLPTDAQILGQLEQSAVGVTDLRRFLLLPKLSMAAYNAGDLVKANNYASELLADASAHADHWPLGNAVHFGNIVAGRVALAKGDVKSAQADLLAAGRTPGSPALNSFGPNMALARDLLAKNERATVVEYLNECKSFWSEDNDRISKWITAIQQGSVPDFGPNLVYGTGR